MYNSFNRFQDTASPAKNFEYESQTEGGSKNRIKNFFYLCPLIFLLIALLFAIVMLHYHHEVDTQQHNEAVDAVKVMGANLEKHMIKDLKTVKAHENCPTGYKHQSLKGYYGTESGCLCSDGSVHSKSYCWFKSNHECKYSSGFPSKSFKSIHGAKICLQRFSSLTLQNAEGKCPTTHPKKCPSQVCMKANEDCQVTKVTAADGAATETQNYLGPQHHLEVSKEAAGGHSVIDFIPEISNFPCSAMNIKRPHTSSKKVYPLDVVKTTGCGKYGDIKTLSSGKLTEQKLQPFYKENDLEAITTTLPFWKHYHTEKDLMGLYTENKLKVPATKECHGFNHHMVNDYISHVDTVISTIHILSWIIIVLAAIGIVLSLLFLIFRHKLAFLNNRVILQIIYAIAFIVAVLCIVLFAIYIHNKHGNYHHNGEEKLEQGYKHKCFAANHGFNTAAKDLIQSKKSINENTGYIIKTLFAAAIIFIVVSIAAMGLRISKKMKPLPDPKA